MVLKTVLLTVRMHTPIIRDDDDDDDDDAMHPYFLEQGGIRFF
jgi:hypothetical protein